MDYNNLMSEASSRGMGFTEFVNTLDKYLPPGETIRSSARAWFYEGTHPQTPAKGFLYQVFINEGWIDV